MRAGALDRRVELLQAAVLTDDYGGEAETWSVAFVRWAERVGAGVGERIAAGEVAASAKAIYRVRYDRALAAQVDATWRLFDRREGRAYSVSGVEVVDRIQGVAVPPNSWIEITAIARAERSL